MQKHSLYVPPGRATTYHEGYVLRAERGSFGGMYVGVPTNPSWGARRLTIQPGEHKISQKNVASPTLGKEMGDGHGTTAALHRWEATQQIESIPPGGTSIPRTRTGLLTLPRWRTREARPPATRPGGRGVAVVVRNTSSCGGGNR